MSALAGLLATERWTLRTGGAPGADQAFQNGAVGQQGDVELYLPWPSFEADFVAGNPPTRVLEDPAAPAFEIAEPFHPAWPRLKQGVKRLMARNAHQVLGAMLDRPVDLIVCWTPDGSLDGKGPDTGGTGMALRLAQAYGKPLVINLSLENHFAYILGIIV